MTINNSENSGFKIFNVGDLIDQVNLTNIDYIDLSEFSDGIYYFEIYKDKLIFTKKIIKNTKNEKNNIINFFNTDICVFTNKCLNPHKIYLL